MTTSEKQAWWTEPRLRPKEVAKILAIKPQHVRRLTHNTIGEATIPPKRGSARTYAPLDVFRMKVGLQLLNAGVTRTRVLKACEVVKLWACVKNPGLLVIRNGAINVVPGFNPSTGCGVEPVILLALKPVIRGTILGVEESDRQIQIINQIYDLRDDLEAVRTEEQRLLKDIDTRLRVLAEGGLSPSAIAEWTKIPEIAVLYRLRRRSLEGRMG